MTMDERPSVGRLVVTADGEELGRVKEVSGDCFKVDAPMAFDYWLPDDIATVTRGVVHLTVRMEHLKDVKEGNPAHSGRHKHS